MKPTEINIFGNVWDRDCSNTTTLTNVLNAIRDGRWDDLVVKIREAKEAGDNHLVKELKSRLPCVTWTGLFSERLDGSCIKYSSFMVIDIDGITKTRLERLKEELINNPWVYAYFESPSNGIKILVRIDSTKERHNTDAFLCLENDFKELYNIEIDKSGKNLSRLCFVSSDPLTYVNTDAAIYKVIEVEEEFSLAGFQAIFNNDKSAPSTDTRYIMDVCLKMIKKSKTGSFHKGNRNNYVFVLSCLLCEFGVNPEQALGLIGSRYPSLGGKEIKTTIESAYRRNKHNFGTKTATKRGNSNQQSIL